jgi:hypothetical protein
MRNVGSKAVRYGPQAAILWKYAAVPVTAAAQRAFAAQVSRRTALKHADTVNAGAILMVMDAGETHWVVFSAGKPVAAYPTSTRSLDELIADANLNKKMTPEQFRARQTAASRRQTALDAAHGVVTQLRNRGPDA